jgi:hypothetical protein
MGGVRWTERLSGWMSFDQRDFNQALLGGRRDGTSLSAELTIEVEDLDLFARSQARRAGVSGTVQCAELGGRLAVKRGHFELLVPSSPLFDALHRRMRYVLELEDAAGRRLRLYGFKLIENDPGYDSWSDTTTLFVRIRTVPDERLLATGVLRITPQGLVRQLTTFRGTEGPLRSRLGDVLRFGGVFAGGLAKVYGGRPIPDGRPSFPRDRPPPPWVSERHELAWHPVPGRTAERDGRFALERELVPFAVPDLAFGLNLHHIRRSGTSAHGDPVLLVHGSGVRAEMFYGQPSGVTIVDDLLAHGYDVWVESWRSSIDFPANSYTLDHAAMLDHPAAVGAVLERTGADTLRAVVHCQGSISFMMSVTAGYIPMRALSHVVSSAVSLFFEVPGATWLKQRTMLPLVRLFGTGGDPQWGIRPQTPAGATLAWLSRHTERPCGNVPCQIANYLFGSGWDVLHRHENLDDDVHAWSARELGYTPFSLIAQVAESCRQGHIVPSATGPDGTPPSYLRPLPPAATRFTFIAGDHNRMFKPVGQQRAAEFLRASGLEAEFTVLEGYGHLDTFWGRNAAADVNPIIRAALGPAGGQTAAGDARHDGEVRLQAHPSLAAFGRRRRRP